MFPDESQPNTDINLPHTTPEEDWQIVIPIANANKLSPSTESAMSKSSDFEGNKERPDDEPMIRSEHIARSQSQSPPPSTSSAVAQMSVSQLGSGIFPAARARLASLRDLGAKKIGALKLKLIENKIKSNERDRSRHNMTSLACMDIPSLVPEVLTTQSGPFFIVQYLKGNHLLSALHSYSDTLSVCHLHSRPNASTSLLLIFYYSLSLFTGAQHGYQPHTAVHI